MTLGAFLSFPDKNTPHQELQEIPSLKSASAKPSSGKNIWIIEKKNLLFTCFECSVNVIDDIISQ